MKSHTDVLSDLPLGIPNRVTLDSSKNPTATNMSIYNAKERIENPYIRYSRIANPAERGEQLNGCQYIDY